MKDEKFLILTLCGDWEMSGKGKGNRKVSSEEMSIIKPTYLDIYSTNVLSALHKSLNFIPSITF